MQTISGENGKEIYLSDEEYRAFEIIKLGRDLGLPPNNVFKELKENNIHGPAMRKGMTAYNLVKKEGASVYKGERQFTEYGDFFTVDRRE